MRVAHLADLHLSYAQFQRITGTGINRREADVALSFTRVVDRVIALEPEVIVVAGDIYHSPRPTNSAIVHAFQQFARITRALPTTQIVMVLGNHDATKIGGTGSVLPLFASLGIHVVDRRAERFRFGDLAILAVPDVPGLDRPAFTPARARYTLAVIHGEVEGMPNHGEPSKKEISAKALNAADWSYCALGHYHVHTRLADNVAYCGAIDYTSTDPWRELREQEKHGVPGKGFVIHDLESGAHEFHAIEPSRRFLDLPAIDAKGMTAEQLNAAIAEHAGDVKDAVVRLVIENIEKGQSNALDYRLIRSLRAKALNFNLALRKPEIVAREPIARSYAELRQRSLPDILAERIARRELPADVDRAALQARALEYLELAGEAKPDADRDLLPSPDRAVA